jgi:hypothetical protein
MINDTPPRDARSEQEDPARKALNTVVQHIIELSQRLLDANVAANDVWFRNLLLGILNSARRDYRSVGVGAKKSPYLAAWGARNLLELRVIAAYIVKSEANAREFQADFVCDNAEFWTSVIKSAVATFPELVRLMREMAASAGVMEEVLLNAAIEEEKRGAPIKEPRGEAAAIKQLMNEEGIDRDRKPRPVVEMAREIGLIDIYGPQAKMYSKLVHPTALSIAASTIAGSLDALMPLVESQAGGDLLMIYSSIEDHVEAHGVAPKR